MKFKRLTAAVLAAASLCCTTAAFAEETEVIAPQTSITNSAIGNLNIYNNIISKHFGNGTSVGQTEVIAPTTILNDVNASLVNVINNVVCVDVNIDMSDISNMISQYQGSIAGGIYK